MNPVQTTNAATDQDATPFDWLSPQDDAEYTLTQLDTPQSTVLEDPLKRPDVRHRFSAHQAAYGQILAQLRSNHEHAARARRLALCGAHATVWHSPSTDQVQVRAYHCGLRCCPRCRETHAARTRDRLLRFTRTVHTNKLSMITLTLRHSNAPLAVQCDNLYRAFKKLRKADVWTEARPSGYAVLEITWNPTERQWHPHLHLLARCEFMKWERLTAAWAIATGGSYVVDIRRVNSRAVEQYHQYLTDYLTKPPSQEIIDEPPLLGEWMDALLHRKVLLRFGRPTLADELPPPVDPADWHLVGTLGGILAGVSRGNKRASYWLNRLQSGGARECRDPDAGKDYLLDLAYQHDPGGVFS